MRKSHTPTADQIDRIVCKVFCADIITVRSKSRKVDDMVPREVSAYLQHYIGGMEIIEIAGGQEVLPRQIYKSIALVRGRIRVDNDFSIRVTEAIRLLINVEP